MTTMTAPTRHDRHAPGPGTSATPPATDRGRRHERDDLHDLARLLAVPIRDADHRVRVDRALALLLGPGGADAPHLRPTRTTPDVVRRRIAGRALSRLGGDDVAHRQVVAGALAILRG